jgi:hypothetical protein
VIEKKLETGRACSALISAAPSPARTTKLWSKKSKSTWKPRDVGHDTVVNPGAVGYNVTCHEGLSHGACIRRMMLRLQIAL